MFVENVLYLSESAICPRPIFDESIRSRFFIGPKKGAFISNRNAARRKGIMSNRIAKKPTGGKQQSTKPTQIMVNSRQLGSKSLAVYLFPKSGANKLFISNSPLDLEKLIGNLRRETTIAG